MASKDKESDSKSEQTPAPSAVEWTARAVSAAIVVGLFGFLLHGALQPDIGPNFALEVRSDKVEQRRNGWAVPVSITNKGTVAVSDVFYEIIAPGNQAQVKKGRIAIFGAGETVDVEVWFDNKPVDTDFDIRVETYAL